jgi:peptide/nickel transport system permease protein
MRFIVRRVAVYLITAWAAITFNFFLPRLMPGDPVMALVTRYQGQMSSDAMAALEVLFGLDQDKSLWQQYVEYWSNLFHGEMGLSFSHFPTPVTDMIAQSVPWTIGLVGVATIVSFLVGTAIGAWIGWRRGTWADAAVPLTTFFSSVPYFWIGLIAVALFGVTWRIFPASGGYAGGLTPAFSGDFLASVLSHAILPVATIVISSVAGWILGMRNMMVTVSSEDYVTVAQAKGLPERAVLIGYAARNAILPQISGFALSLGFVVSGTLVMEMVFSYPGIGYVLYQAVQANDYPMMQGVFLIITVSVLVANMMADFVYVLFDPRTRQEG